MAIAYRGVQGFCASSGTGAGLITFDAHPANASSVAAGSRHRRDAQGGVRLVGAGIAIAAIQIDRSIDCHGALRKPIYRTLQYRAGKLDGHSRSDVDRREVENIIPIRIESGSETG